MSSSSHCEGGQALRGTRAVEQDPKTCSRHLASWWGPTDLMTEEPWVFLARRSADVALNHLAEKSESWEHVGDEPLSGVVRRWTQEANADSPVQTKPILLWSTADFRGLGRDACLSSLLTVLSRPRGHPHPVPPHVLSDRLGWWPCLAALCPTRRTKGPPHRTVLEVRHSVRDTVEMPACLPQPWPVPSPPTRAQGSLGGKGNMGTARVPGFGSCGFTSCSQVIWGLALGTAISSVALTGDTMRKPVTAPSNAMRCCPCSGHA